MPVNQAPHARLQYRGAEQDWDSLIRFQSLTQKIESVSLRHGEPASMMLCNQAFNSLPECDMRIYWRMTLSAMHMCNSDEASFSMQLVSSIC